MPFRLLRYMVRIWEQQPSRADLIPIVPVVLHHSETGWTTSRTFDEVIGLARFAGTGIEPFIPRFAFILDDVSRQSDAAIAARIPNLLVRLVLASLRESRRAVDGPRLVEQLGQLVRDVVRSDAPLKRSAAFSDPQHFLDALANEVGQTTKEDAMGLLEAMLEKGRAEGKAEGLVEARRRTLEKLLQLKFGNLPQATRERIATIEDAALEGAIERVLDAQRMQDVFG